MKYKITIPKPCHENWNEMTATQKGRFCKSCSKEVIDFTKLTSSNISKKVLNNGNLCGRFKNTQLNKEIKIIRRNHASKVAASLALLSTISVSEPFFSQTKKDTIEAINHKQAIIGLRDNLKEKYVTVKGNVSEESGILPGVSILLKGTNIGAETDFDGNFSIKIPNKKRKSTILVISYLGYKSQEIDVLFIKKTLKIILVEIDEELLGEIIITAGMIAIERKPNLLKRVGNFFKKNENK